MAQRLEDARGRYITFLKRNFPKDLSLDGVRLVIDCANGATYRIAPAVFQELGASVELIGVKPDGKNINEACGAVHPEGLASRVKETGAQAGVAFDGDGDRVVVCDGKGRIFDGDDILAILAGPLKDSGELGAGVVGTVMTNFGLERHFADRGIAFHRAPVGDRYVVEKMRETGALLGGEPSGHIVSLARSTTGDGILTALLLMAVTVRAQKPLAEFAGSFRRYPQELRNVRVRERKPLEGIPAVAASIRSGEERLKGSGRVLVRYSGTEAKARVMVEGENADLVREIAAEIEAAIRTEIGGS
jgi:phosphoglucosamine mutase